jgi:uncharacterized RDD family membrane protein YckC
LSKAKTVAAGLLLRSLAFSLDYVLIAAYLAVLIMVGVALQSSAPRLAAVLFGDPLAGEATGWLLITLPVTLYFSLSEASSRQGTWGKTRMRLEVTDSAGRRLGLARSLGRSTLKFVPWELAHACIWQVTFARDPSAPIYALGFALVWVALAANVVSMFLSPERQTLYDRAVGSIVVRVTPLT